MRSTGCSTYPDTGWAELVPAIEGLRGDPAFLADRAELLAKRLSEGTDWKARIGAAKELSGLGTGAAPAIPVLIELLALPHHSTSLAAPGREPVADRLARVRRGEEERNETLLAAGVVTTLVAIGEPARPDLIKALRDKSPDRRRRATTALASIRSPDLSAAAALTEALNDEAASLEAARALVVLQRRTTATDPQILDILIRNLRGPDADAARRAVTVLAEMRPAPLAAVEALAEALDDHRTQRAALGALAKLGPGASAAVPHLARTLDDDDAAIRQNAASALGNMGAQAERAVPVLTRILSTDPSGGVRAAAAGALGSIGSAAAPAVPALIEALRYGDEGHRLASTAGGALSQIGELGLSALINALKCDHLDRGTPMERGLYRGPRRPEIENVRFYAARTLSHMRARARAAIPALNEALRDEYPRVREQAARALREIDKR